jgi:hypothetical protein
MVMMPPSSTTTLAVCLLLLLVTRSAEAHGLLSTPLSRNGYHSSDYCPHCLNAGGECV